MIKRLAIILIVVISIFLIAASGDLLKLGDNMLSIDSGTGVTVNGSWTFDGNTFTTVETGAGNNDTLVTKGYSDDATGALPTSYLELTDTPGSYTTINALSRVNGTH